jgi:hypothetical protein
MLAVGNNDAGWEHSAEGGHATADVVAEKVPGPKVTKEANEILTQIVSEYGTTPEALARGLHTVSSVNRDAVIRAIMLRFGNSVVHAVLKRLGPF